MLGISRRVYYQGTALLVVALGIVYGLALNVLQAVERVTNGGVCRCTSSGSLDHGRALVPELAIVVVLLVLFFLYGMWYGLVYRRWSVPGLVTFIAAQVLVALLVVVVVSATQLVRHRAFFTTLTALALTGVLAAVAAAMGAGGCPRSPGHHLTAGPPWAPDVPNRRPTGQCQRILESSIDSSSLVSARARDTKKAVPRASPRK